MSEDGPLARYEARRAAGALAEDPAQREAAARLQDLHERLALWRPSAGAAGRPWRFAFLKKPAPAQTPEAPRGLYIWGGVGRGKSMLMDLFFQGAPVHPKRRVHFHEFMRETHARLAEARLSGGADPVPPVARGVAEGARLLCFDEMQVTDIADAMLLGRLFEALFAMGVTVVATSNRPPEDLYKDGLNRDLFLPFIDMIKQRMELVRLDGVQDHRMAGIDAGEAWFAPLGPESAAAMDDIWRRLTEGAPGRALTLRVQGRDVVIPRAHEGMARAGFGDLCARPLGASDYLALAENFHTLMLDRIPVLTPARRNEARRLVILVDALYEAKRRLIVSAAGAPEELYPEGDGAFEFERTASRLNEMRSRLWLEGFDAARAAR